MTRYFDPSADRFTLACFVHCGKLVVIHYSLCQSIDYLVNIPDNVSTLPASILSNNRITKTTKYPQVSFYGTITQRSSHHTLALTVTVLHQWRVAHSRAVKITQNHIHVSHVLADKRKDDFKTSCFSALRWLFYVQQLLYPRQLNVI